MDNIIFSNKDNFEEIKKRFQENGLNRVHVLTDFDRTLTKAFVDGQEVPSLISVLRDENYLTSDYADKAHELYNKYRPLEDDESFSKEEKKKIMYEWWSAHFQLLIESGLSKKDIKEVIKSNKIRFRDGFSEFLTFLKNKNIPLVVVSSSGLGREPILQKFKKEGKLYNNIHIVSNDFKWDEKGNVVDFKKPIIHTANKDETLIRNFPEIFNIIKERKNVIVLGDTLDDVGMIEGFNYDNLLKIAFLNKKTEPKKEIYKKFYDVLLLGDSSLEFIYLFLKNISLK